MRKLFYFNTGVRPGIPANEAHILGARPVGLTDGQVWLNGTKQIPFECDDVPEGAIFQFAANDPLLHMESKYIVREIRNSTLCSKYAYFSKPYKI